MEQEPKYDTTRFEPMNYFKAFNLKGETHESRTLGYYILRFRWQDIEPWPTPYTNRSY